MCRARGQDKHISRIGVDFHATSAIFDAGAANPIELPLLAAVETHNSPALHALLAHRAPFQSPDQVPRRALRPNPLLVAAQRHDLPTLTTLLTLQYKIRHSCTECTAVTSNAAGSS